MILRAGNLVTVIIIAAIGDGLTAAHEYYFFAVLATIAALVMTWLGSRFDYKHQGQPLPDSDEGSKAQ
jgi:hypothetical protein